jgi:hypothetical protein
MWKPHALDCYRSILERPGHWFSKLLIWVANDLSWFELVNWSSNVLMCNRWMCSCMCSHEDTCLCGRINVSKCSPPMRKQFFFSMLSLISSVEKNPSLINYLHKNFFFILESKHQPLFFAGLDLQIILEAFLLTGLLGLSSFNQCWSPLNRKSITLMRLLEMSRWRISHYLLFF